MAAAVTPELVTALGLLAALGAGLAIYLGLQRARRWRERVNYTKAQTCSRDGQGRAAVRFTLKADAAWRLHHSGRAVRFYVDDLDRLVAMYRMLRREMASLGTGLDLYDLEQAARGMKRLCSNSDNFTWDQRTMKPDTALSWNSLLRQLNEARDLIRGICEQTLRR